MNLYKLKMKTCKTGVFSWRSTAHIPSLLNRGKTTYLTKAKTPFSSRFPGSQKAFFNFFLTDAELSKRSILESSKDELIFPPVRPGTNLKKKKKLHTQGNKSIIIKDTASWWV